MLVNRITSIKTTVTKLVTSHKIHSCEISLVRVKPLVSKGCGRGEIGKHKGLKTAYLTGLVTRVHANLFNQFNYLLDTLSVAPLVKGRSDVTVS